MGSEISESVPLLMVIWFSRKQGASQQEPRIRIGPPSGEPLREVDMEAGKMFANCLFLLIDIGSTPIWEHTLDDDGDFATCSSEQRVLSV